ncbi:GNAT family N-acetyltransferase [Solibacillus sp. MA9]|uniref:GNAT family N-acetyltransferase n=1 Tax=Solibacillus palustris TaxID=2908203 RepID=A0ABS9UFG5_9BACL|nr:GNAT family N-acetyltransferase [Solibacillus sp. MA9]MCH7323084.1 GNAT family N-acetyltransferase [Solibacillus sp. MA9]
MNFIKGEVIRNNVQLKQSFLQLAKETFGLEFEQWDALGYWDNTYCPYAFEVDGKIVANVSANIGTMLVEGKTYQAIQIGTVMTNSAFQGQGISRKLMEKVLEDTADAAIIYLFANETVLNFYPKFGFETRRQATFTIETKDLNLQPTEVKKVDISDEAARKLFYETTKHRMPISSKMSMLQNENIVMFHALTQYKDAIYYVPKFHAFVIAKEQNGYFQLIDVISKQYVDLLEIIESLPIQEKMVELCFTPENLKVPVQQGIFQDEGAMFVKEQSNLHYPNDVLYPYSGLA